MNLFDYMAEQEIDKKAPLAARMRPRTLEEMVGQQHIIGQGKLLYRAIKADRLSSVILYGPPGTGKTTLAMVIANTTKASFEQVNATVAGKHDLEQVVQRAKESLGGYGRRTILFIDEIHRFSKSQQDYLLPYVENGTVILIGATTENPYFEVNGALLSRSRIFELLPLSKEDVLKLIHRAIEDRERGLGASGAVIADDAADFLADVADGDARAALNAIELAVLTSPVDADGKIHIDLETAQECIQKKAIRYDKDGDQHYDTVAAFIESMTGSDPDAALYYLARMISAGEDERYIARRIMVAASEEAGNADPMAIVVASACAQAVERIGMPESRIILAHAAVYVACAPKSDAIYMDIEKAMKEVEKSGNLPIPSHLKDQSYKSAARLGHGVGYLYPHYFKNHWVKQQYLPDALQGTTFYDLTDIGYEQKIREYFQRIKQEEN